MLQKMLLTCGVCLAVCALSVAQEKAFELGAHQRLSWDGKVVDHKVERDRHGETEAKPEGVEFSVIPTRLMDAMTWNNPVTGGVEQRIWPMIEHPIPVLRAAHVRLYEKAPDLATLAVDIVDKDPNEVEIMSKTPVAIVGDGAGRVMMITLSEVNIPQDKPGEWKIAGTIKPITIVDHIADPIADRGRAVPAKEPLPLSGTLVFGKRRDMMNPTTFHAIDLSKPDAQPRELVRGVVDGRVATNGTLVDKYDSRALRMTDSKGKALGEIKLERDIAEFNISPNGKYVVYNTERFVDVPNDAPRREAVACVHSVDGRKLSEIVDYDDAAFLPDGNLVVTGWSAGEGLFVTNLKAGKATRIEFQDAPTETADGRTPDWWPRTPAVSPDGKWVAFVSGREVYVIGIDGKGWTPVWIDPTHQPQSSPVFSPDSKYVAMIVTPLDVMTGPGQVLVYDLQRHLSYAIRGAPDAHSDVPLTWMPAEN